jgi:hypothetical protein
MYECHEVWILVGAKHVPHASDRLRFSRAVLVAVCILGPFRLAKKTEFVNAEFVFLFPTPGLINWFLKLALTTVFTSSPYFFAGGAG